MQRRMERKKLWLFIIQMAPVFLRSHKNAAAKQQTLAGKHLHRDQVITWKNVAKFVVVVSSFSGFFYQSSEYFIEFFSFPTAVSVVTERSTIIGIPSLTICVPSLTARSGLDREYPELKAELSEIHSSHDHNHGHKLLSARKLYGLYENRSAVEKSPQEFFRLGIHADDIIACKVLRPIYFHHLNDTWIPCPAVSDVLETIGPNGKCFTYFSLLTLNDTRDYKKRFLIDIDQSVRDEAGLAIEIRVKFNPSNYIDSSKIGDELITLHESSAVPTEGKKRRLKPGTNYDIFFAKINTTYLPPPYQTECRSYEVFDKDRPQSRADCVDRCIKEIYYNDCHCYPLHVVVRYDIVINHDFHMCNKTSAEFERCQQREMSSRCFERCPLDCEEISYDFDTEEDVFPTDREIQEEDDPLERQKLNESRNFFAQIRLWRKVSGDTFYIHKAQLPLIQLFSFVGGLASLWLGISIIAFYDILIHIVTVVYKTKPFEKMRKRDAAVSVLSNWGNNGSRISPQSSVIKR